MTRGIYVLANDHVIDNAIALLSSIRAHDPDVPVVLIPYDDRHEAVTTVLRDHFGVRLYEDQGVIQRLDDAVQRLFGPRFFRRPQMFRKQACWFGPFDEFLYLDADIVVFERIVEILGHLAEFDFVCCDDQYRYGIKHVFSPEVIRQGVFSPSELLEIFNAGFWGAKRGILTESALYAYLAESADHPAYFDFKTGCSDQPIFNYVVLKRIPRRINLLRAFPDTPQMWAGTPGFVADGERLIDPSVGKPLRYLHWAGYRPGPGAPYWDTWRHFRFRHPGVPATLSAAHSARAVPPPLGRRLLRRVRRALGLPTTRRGRP